MVRALLWVVFLFLSFPAVGAPVVYVMSDFIPLKGKKIFPGEIVTINIVATVTQPLSSEDGIFTFDQDYIVTNQLPGLPATVQIVGVTRPNVSDSLFGGSDGTVGASGLLAIHGGYLDNNRGIGSPAVLYSVQVQGISPGVNVLTPGPAVNPFGFDMVLYGSRENVTVQYDEGVELEVIIPEPSSIGLLICMSFLAARRRAIGSRRRAAA